MHAYIVCVVCVCGVCVCVRVVWVYVVLFMARTGPTKEKQTLEAPRVHEYFYYSASPILPAKQLRIF